MQNYQSIKSARKSGESVTVADLDSAITAQKTVVTTATSELAKAVAELHLQPSELAKAVVAEKSVGHLNEIRRLSKLYGWLTKVKAAEPLTDVEIPDELPEDLG